ncbi:uncharacterized protein LOC106467969 [Limulus polyphemus]|uniref:Uncharacterized protein LOC106467969 n=1 Tax=Limulus polyphemus TaxID=6850 RepID=A0ABM1BKI3_LIMPO|nr:uncharacterized protein LOC106467969 [Limulus polyphemus]
MFRTSNQGLIRCKSLSGMPKLEGYLSKRGKLNLRCSWKKYWFVLEGRQFMYYKSKASYESLGVCKGMIDFSQIQSVRMINSTLNFEFDVITRRNAIHLAAFDSETRKLWVEALQKLIGRPAEVSGPMNAQRISAPRLSRLFEASNSNKAYVNETHHGGDEIQFGTDEEKNCDCNSETKTLLKNGTDDINNDGLHCSLEIYKNKPKPFPGNEDSCSLNNIHSSSLSTEKHQLLLSEDNKSTSLTISQDSQETFYRNFIATESQETGNCNLQNAGTHSLPENTSSEQNWLNLTPVVPELHKEDVPNTSYHSIPKDIIIFEDLCDTEVTDGVSHLVLIKDTPSSSSPEEFFADTVDSYAVQELKNFITILGEEQEAERYTINKIGKRSAINSMKSLLDDMNQEERFSC